MKNIAEILLVGALFVGIVSTMILLIVAEVALAVWALRWLGVL